jgi:hypothetical protein
MIFLSFCGYTCFSGRGVWLPVAACNEANDGVADAASSVIESAIYEPFSNFESIVS